MTTEVQGYVQSRIYMDTIVTIQVSQPDAATAEKVERAFGWFREVEQRCSRFDATSELRTLCARPGEAVAVSPLLFRAIEFALSVAEATNGAFDPAVGALMARRGFNRSYRSGEETTPPATDACFEDVVLDAARSTVMLRRPLLLDLGAVAKGLAVDLAAAELEATSGFLINAGGDIRVQGLSPDGELWRIGVKDPNNPARLMDVVELTDGAVCSSGGYERPAQDGGHHIVSPLSGESPSSVAGVTVIAPSAMVADALSTAAFVMGLDDGIAVLDDAGVEGTIVTESGLAVLTRTHQRCWS